MGPSLQTWPGQVRLSTDLEKHLDWYSPKDLEILGCPRIADAKRLALFCSRKCPGSLIIQTHDLAHALREAAITVIGGFHSSVELECLNVLHKGRQPLIVCPARSLDSIRVPTPWRVAIDQGRLLLLSPFPKRQRRATADLAQKRNEFVAALADAVFIAYAAPGSATERLCRKALAWDKRVFSFNCRESESVIRLGVEPVGVLPTESTHAREFWFHEAGGA